MRKGALSDYFDGVGTKALKATEVDPTVSRGHELQGIDDFKRFLGTPSGKTRVQVTYVWLDDDAEPATVDGYGTWYDSRRGRAGRSPEYRLYYPKAAEEIVYRARSGDRLFLCKSREGPVLALFCKRESSIERQLLWLFNLRQSESTDLTQVDLREAAGRELDIAARHILELFNIEITAGDDRLLDLLFREFKEVRNGEFPPTTKFSAFARSIAPGADPLSNPDAALLAWMDVEERLFMTLERHFVAQKLEAGFVVDGKPDVDAFVGFSLSVHNRRKSRAGWAFGNHIEALLREHGVRFKREAKTEKRNGPDFLFPGETEYHDPDFPADGLMMLAAKTSCKDRWRQVLAEADRITSKHLVTLEPGISLTQTTEMKRSGLHLVVPSALHESYLPRQREHISTVAQFINLVRERGQGAAYRSGACFDGILNI